jgi:hypothetical protein
MLSITLLTICVCLSSMGIINGLNSLEIAIKMRDLKKDIKEVQNKNLGYSQRK